MRIAMTLLALSLLTSVSSAQQELFRFGVGGPTTRVIVLNATDDSAAIWVQIGGKMSKPLPLGGQWGRSFGYGENGSAEVTVTVCPAYETIRRSPIPPPEWATDEEKFGANALTSEFLQNDPAEKDVEKRINGIKRTLAGKLGRKEKGGELKEWFRAVKRSGAAPSVTGCENPQFLTWTQDVSQWGYGRTASVAIRGSRLTGYRRDLQQQ